MKDENGSIIIILEVTPTHTHIHTYTQKRFLLIPEKLKLLK